MILSYLSVQNFSVIGDVELDLEEGLNIFTGETGAGKTLIVNAIKLLLGEKLNKNFFRDEAKPIRVQGIFRGDFSRLPEEIRDEFEITDEIIIKREVDIKGKNKVTINQVVTPLKVLQELTDNFVDIHGQHEHQLLLNPRNHLMFVDSLIDSSARSAYSNNYSKLRQIERSIKEETKNIDNLKKEKEYIQYQIEEISSLRLNPHEDEALEEKIQVLSNIDRIKTALSSALISLSEGEINAEGLLSNALKELNATTKYGKEFEQIVEKIDAILYDVQDISKVVENTLSKYEVDEKELNYMIERKNSIDKVKKKYSKDTINDLLQFLEELKKKLERIEFQDQRIRELEAEKVKIINELTVQKTTLNKLREELSKSLSKKITTILKDLELKNAEFYIDITDNGVFDEKAGIDLEFYISTNTGFKPGPLSKIASGGEISRVMLALKEAFSEVDDVGVLLFDEIDTGISGTTARKVGEKLKAISKNKQVIVITHLPVVAAKGDIHFHLVKEDDGHMSRTNIIRLNADERIKVIASMISGNVTDLSIKQAMELVEK